MIRITIIAVFLLSSICSQHVLAQVANVGQDSVRITINQSKVKDPKTATLLSAIVPGAGQVYNGKAWKVPMIYSGFAANIYFIDFNGRRYTIFREALQQFDKGIPNSFPNLNRDGLVRNVNFWRRNRDLNYFLFIGIYALNIIDAHVDAHLSAFDVSDDLSLRFEPSFETLSAGGNIFGLSMKIYF
jgi:hypothetical protein